VAKNQGRVVKWKQHKSNGDPKSIKTIRTNNNVIEWKGKCSRRRNRVCEWRNVVMYSRKKYNILCQKYLG
jgi:hypothetical protein